MDDGLQPGADHSLHLAPSMLKIPPVLGSGTGVHVACPPTQLINDAQDVRDHRFIRIVLGIENRPWGSCSTADATAHAGTR